MPDVHSPIRRFPEKTADVFYTIFAGIFALCFVITLTQGLFAGASYPFSVPGILVSTGAALAVLAGICALLRHFSDILQRRFPIVSLSAGLLLFAGGLVLAVFLRFEPEWDLEAVFRGAEQWALTGDFTTYASEHCHANYFYIFPNNFGGMLLLYLWFRPLALLGVHDFYFPAVVLNLLLICGTMLVTAHTARRLYGGGAGVFVLCLFLLSPFWFAGTVFYTDTLSMFFPAAALALFLSARDAPAKRAVPLCAAGGLLLAVGGAVKTSALVLLPAVGIELLLRGKPKRFAAFLGITALCIALVNTGVGAVRDRHIDRERLAEERMPTSYWLALGCSGEGRYDNRIFALASAQPDARSRDRVMRETAAESIRANGVGGTIRLFVEKSGRVFGDGTYAFSDFLDDEPVSRNALHEFLLPTGHEYSVYITVASGVFFAVQILAIGSLRRPWERPTVVPQLCLLGILLFFTVWENNGRSAVNAVPYLFLAAAGPAGPGGLHPRA